MEKEFKWVIDPAHSEISFKAKHLMITNIKGSFKDFEANVYSTGDDFISADIDIWINPASIDTGNEERDKHLKGPDFFDVEHHKEINFTAHSYEKAETDKYKLTGDLTIKGLTKRVTFEVVFQGMMKDPWGNDKAGFTITGKINRKDWDLNWNTLLEAGGVLVGDEIQISGEVQLVRAAEVFTDVDKNDTSGEATKN